MSLSKKLKMSLTKFHQIHRIISSCQLTTTSINNKRRQDSPLNIADKLQKSEVNSSNLKSKLPPVVPIWKSMSIIDLSNSLQKSVDHIYDVMTYIPNTNNKYDNNTPIEDLNIIREIVKKSGFRSIIESNKIVIPMTYDHLELSPRPIIESDLIKRSPVVTIMGHVDHGKTTLLDSLRDSNIVDGEAGGITQHIGAFKVKVGSNYITFLDTPGHAAFSALRNRGAMATDMVILVVAADDGVMDQTRESIAMSNSANVPIIVAINKIDKSNANIENTKQMLLTEGIQLEDFGGDVQSVNISALKGTNIDELMEAVMAQAEIMNLRSERNGNVEGVVLESTIDSGRGKLCSGLVQRGVLNKSDILVAGTAWAKVRALFDENGDVIQSAEPSKPCQIIGWRDIPQPGEKIYQVESEKLAKEIIEYRISLNKEKKQSEDAVAIQEKMELHNIDYYVQLQEKRRLKRRKLRPTGPRQKQLEDTSPRLNIIIKSDVDGSVESFLDVLETYNSNLCRLDIIHYGVGDLTITDIKLAEDFNAYIYLFNTKIPIQLKDECKKFNIRQSNIIYRLIDDLKKDLESKIPMIEIEEIIGIGNVMQGFIITEGKKKIFIAGGKCTQGTLIKNAKFKLIRGEQLVYEGKVTSMRHLKNEVDSIKNGVECGIGFEDEYIEPQAGDTIVCYKKVQVSQKCDWDPGF